MNDDDGRRGGAVRVPAGIAAHDPDTMAVGREILADGGSAADAAVAATLAACVAESMMTGLAGGGHAIHYTATTGQVDLLDFFVAVPGIGGPPCEIDFLVVDMAFDDEAVTHDLGPASVGVPGVAAGCGALSERFGRMPWNRLVDAVLPLARAGSVVQPTQANALPMVAPAMALNEGAAIYAPHGQLLQAGEVLRQPGLVAALELLRDEGARSFYEGTIAQVLLDVLQERGSAMTAADLAHYEVLWPRPQEVGVADVTVVGRRALGGTLEALAALENLRGSTPAQRAVAFANVLGGDDRHGDTTNVTTVDRNGNACVVTTSLGLGSTDWLPGLDIHLNSMLGERALISGPLVPGEHLGSMMCPNVSVDSQGLVAAAGAAGGARIRSALVQVLSGVLAEGLAADVAVTRPRLHVDGNVVHLEPDYPAEGIAALQAAGWVTRGWRTRHHFFGGVSLVGRTGACGEPRRDGAATVLP